MPRAVAVDLDVIFENILLQVRSLGALPRSELARYKRHLPTLAPRLREAGIEVGRTVRLPLESQLVERTRSGFTPLRGLDKKVAGASAAEVKICTQQLLDRGALTAVVRESGVGFMHADAPGTLAAADLAELLRQVGKAQKLLRQALAKRKTKGYARATVLAVDLPLRASSAPEPPATPNDESDPDVHRVGRAVAARLSHVPLRAPDAMRDLEVPADLARRALVEGAARGWFTLQPESGMGRLTADDARYCPEGPHGTKLSWIVRKGTS